MTRDKYDARGEGKAFASPEEVRIAFDAGDLDIQARIRVRMKNLPTDEKPQIVDTTTGRIILREILPEQVPFATINKVMTKKELTNLVDVCNRLAGNKETVILADKLKETGFRYSTLAGISICINDMVIPGGKPAIIEGATEEVKEIQNQYTEGLITDGERYNKLT